MPRLIWTKETIHQKALNYNTRNEFITNNRGAYFAARRLEIIDEVCSHMPKVKHWLPEAIHQEALKYNKRSEFKKNSSGAHSAAIRLGILDDVCSHIPKAKRWTTEEISQEALKYNTRSEFKENSRSAYYTAIKLDILDDICSHMDYNIKEEKFKNRKRRRARKWLTLEAIQQEALKYNTRSEFSLSSGSAYHAASRHRILDDICSHMFTSGARRWLTLEAIQQEALKYNTRNEFRKNSSAYIAATKLGILDDICSHMPIVKNWTIEEIQYEALKYNTRNELFKENNNVYHAAIRLGILDEICNHMLIPKHWTPETIHQETLKYNTRSEFSLSSGSAYHAAINLGILDDVCSHMISLVIPPNIIYIWSSIEYPEVWKIGISSVIKVNDRIKAVAKAAELTINESYHKQIKNPRQMERMLLASGEVIDFGRKFDGHTEFRRLNDDELYSAKEIFELA